MVRALEHALSSEQEPTRKAVPKALLKRQTMPRLIRYALTDWAIIVVCWSLMGLSPGWLYPLFVLVIAGRFHSFGVILHDATHMPLRGKTVGTRIMEALCGYPIATTLNAMRFHHLRHHKDSGMASDPYFKPTVRDSRVMAVLIWLRHLLLVPWWTFRGPFGLACLVAPRLRNFYARAFLQDRSGRDMTHSREIVDCARAELGQVLFHAALIAVACAWPTEVLYYYLIPVTVTGLLAGYRVLREHDYVPTMDRKVKTIMQTTVDHNLGPIGRLFFAPRNIGYHVVHHIHPQVALEHLPALRRWYQERHPELYPAPDPTSARAEQR